jgi:hypothetical protein
VHAYSNIVYLNFLKIADFTRACLLVADLSRLPKVPLKNKNGSTYYRVDFDVVLNFGLTELQAQLRWREEVSIFQVVAYYTEG